jgi:cyanophycin synthetase
VNIPLTFGGKAIFMIQNILPVVMASYLRGFSIEDIKAALETFIPSPAQTPGRMNVFNFQKFTVIIDYAHNPAGLQALGKFLEKVEDSPKVGIITGVGDRRDEDIKALGAISARIFDQIIIRQDKHLRGRSDTEIVELLEQGIRSIKPEAPVTVIFKEVEAIEYAIKNAVPGSFIVVCSDVVAQAVDVVLRLREEDAKLVIRHEDIPNLSI